MEVYDAAGEPSEGSGPELITPEQFLPPNPFPWDAQRMGIDRFTGDNGALIAFAASLDRTKPLHRLMAWLMLIVVGGPVLITVISLLR